MKELKPSGLFYVPVPDGQTVNSTYEIVRSQDNFKMRQLHYPESVWNGYQEYGRIDLGEKDFEIIGSVTAEHIDFDPSAYIETTLGKTWAKDYTTGKFIDNASQAFRSLLTANDVHFVNPYGEKPSHPIQDSIMEEGLHDRYKERLKEWQQAESKLVEKILILKPL